MAQQPLELPLSTSLPAIEYWAGGLMTHPLTEWSYPVLDNSQDDYVRAVTELVAYENEDRRLLRVGQWFGRQATSGEVIVKYNVVELKRGHPLVIWRAGAVQADDVKFMDVLSERAIPVDPAVVSRLASLLPNARPINPKPFQDPLADRIDPFATFIDTWPFPGT